MFLERRETQLFIERPVADIQLPAKGGKRDFLVIVKNVHRVALIGVLSIPIRPSTVIRRVIAVCINAIKTVSWRASAHVSNKVAVGASPALTHFYPSSSIVLPSRDV